MVWPIMSVYQFNHKINRMNNFPLKVECARRTDLDRRECYDIVIIRYFGIHQES